MGMSEDSLSDSSESWADDMVLVDLADFLEEVSDELSSACSESSPLPEMGI